VTAAVASPNVRADRGAATVEIAIALPSLVVVVMAAVTAVAVVTAQLRCLDAAREGARAAARGEPPAAVRDIARQVAPAPAGVTVTAEAGRVAVDVSTTVRLLSGRGPSITVEGRAVAAAEPGVGR
jgi:Flp pilus assembly protein TadG